MNDGIYKRGLVSESTMGKAADQLNYQLERAEVLIRNKGFGVMATVELDGDYHLMFCKRQDRWGLFVEYVTEACIPLLSVSIQLRVLAARAIPALVEELYRVRANHTLDIANSTDELCAYLDKELVYPGVERVVIGQVKENEK